MSATLTSLALPPTGPVLLALLGLLLCRRGRPWGLGLAATALGSLLLLATPLVADLLCLSLERELAHWSNPEAPEPEAIVILGGDGAHTGAGGLNVGPLTLERLSAGVALHRRTGLPLLVAGGVIAPGTRPIAAAMAESLAEDFRVPPRWIERRSANTRENAEFSAGLLRAEGIRAAYLVTHGWHLPRALWSFGRRGFPVWPVPVRPHRAPSWQPKQMVPQAIALAQSHYALREWLGRLVDRLRG